MVLPQLFVALSAFVPLVSSFGIACFSRQTSFGSCRVSDVATSSQRMTLHSSRVQKDFESIETTGFSGIIKEKELSLEEQIEEIRQEVAAQAEEAALEEFVVIPSDDEITEDEAVKLNIETDEDFVDEGKKIIWPGTRRVLQLTVLTIAAEILFFFWIIAVNSLSVSLPAIMNAVSHALRASSQ